MREVKIRVWDEECKSWRELPDLYGDYQSCAYRTYGEPFSIVNFFASSDQEGAKEGKLIIEQYTGLKDKHGEEIYEGDIVSGDTEVLDFQSKEKSKGQNIIGPIHFHHSYWAIGDYKLFICDDETLEILGNIHENPELLK